MKEWTSITRLGITYTIMSFPDRKRVALCKYDKAENNYTPIAYFLKEEDAMEWDKFLYDMFVSISGRIG